MWRRLLVGASLPVLVAACAPAASQLERVQFARNPSVLSRQEWVGTNVTTAYDAVSRLRPDFFKRRGATSILFQEVTALNVYMDNMRLGGLETLRDIPVASIQSIRYLSAGEATYRWGANQTGGAIQLLTH